MRQQFYPNYKPKWTNQTLNEDQLHEMIYSDYAGLYNQALCLENLGRYDEAKNTLEQSINLMPKEELSLNRKEVWYTNGYYNGQTQSDEL